MNLLVTFNCKDNFNFIDKNVLYLFQPPLRKIKNCKYVDFCDNLEDYCIKSLFKFKNNYEIIGFVDNSVEVDINQVFNFKYNYENWLIYGNIVKEKVEKFSLNGLFINCKNLKEEDVSLFYPSKEGEIDFSYFSRILYRKYFLCYENISLGFKLKKYKSLLI